MLAWKNLDRVSERLVHLGIMEAQLRALLSLSIYHSAVMSKGFQRGPNDSEKRYSLLDSCTNNRCSLSSLPIDWNWMNQIYFLTRTLYYWIITILHSPINWRWNMLSLVQKITKLRYNLWRNTLSYNQRFHWNMLNFFITVKYLINSHKYSE